MFKKIYILLLLTIILNSTATIIRNEIINENEYYVWYTVTASWGKAMVSKNLLINYDSQETYFVYDAYITQNRKATQIYSGPKAEKFYNETKASYLANQ